MPVFELLEQRAMLTITYTPLPSTPDGAAGSLRADILLVNANTGSEAIVIQLAAGNYNLTSSSGELELLATASHTVTIEGAGIGSTTIDQRSADRVLEVNTGATVILQNLELTDGLARSDTAGGTSEADGGGILNLGTLTLSDVAVEHNKALAMAFGANAFGGGIYSTGTLTVNGGSIISNNEVNAATSAAGGGAGSSFGGGIYSSTDDAVEISDSTIAGNFALGGAGAFDPPISGTGFGGSGGTAIGGGVDIVNSGTSAAMLNNDTIAQNTAQGGGGGNSPAGVAGNGGIGSGGGVAGSNGALLISNSTISGNYANGGAGGSGASSGGQAGDAQGGGAEFGGSGSQLLNDTIYANTAIGGTGYNNSTPPGSGNASGGGIADLSSGLLIVNVTIAANSAVAGAAIGSATPGTSQGGGIRNGGDGALDIYNTLVAGNTTLDNVGILVPGNGYDFVGAAAIANSNLLGDGTGAIGFGTPSDNNQVGSTASPIDPLFVVGGLKNNGGDTLTVALQPGSPALNAGATTAAISNDLTFDQRGAGFVRIVNGKIDIGAIESTVQKPTVTNSITTENTQTTSGLVITPSSTTTTFFQITGITGGTLFQHDGTTPIVNGDFITLAQGAAGLKFTPTAGSLASGSVTVREATSNVVGGLSGATSTATIAVSLDHPDVSSGTTTENTQTATALVIVPEAHDSSTTFFQITGITGGTLFQHDGTTLIANGDFITLAQGAAGLRFTPTTGSLATGSFTVQESTSNSVAGLSGTTTVSTITVSFAGPKASGATTAENVQTTSGLVLTLSGGDSTAAFFQITNITGGTLFQHDGTTPITNGSFITVAQGEAGLKFTPTTGSVAVSGFSVRESTTGAVGGLSGPTVWAPVTVTLSQPTVTAATTTENTQSTSGLVITPGVHDSTAAFFQITSISGGTLFQNNGTTQITAGSFITVAQGAAGLKFTPVPGSLISGGFTVRQSTTAAVGGLSGPTTRAAITVTLAGPHVTGATTIENAQTTSGLVITRGVNDSSATFFQITGITGGTLFQHNGTTPITAGSLITVAQGAAGLKFTPTTGSLAGGGFTVQESTNSTATGLGGATAAATITVTLAGPKVTAARTTENVQSTSGLVITPGDAGSSVAFFQITGITGGTLFQADGTTAITAGSFITLAQGAAGLKFTPTSGSVAAGSFTVQESTTGVVGGLIGPTAAATITVELAGPKATGATTTENVQTTSGLVITPGTNDTSAAFFQITGISGGTLFQVDGTTPITSGSFITQVQSAAGLKFTPTTGSLAAGSFVVRESTSSAVGGLSGPGVTVTIAVTLSKPTVTAATTQENTQTASGLVITPGAHDTSAAFFQITSITGGTLYQNDGTTPILNGAFITLAQAAAGLKFTPSTGSLVAGGFSVRQSTANAAIGLSGPTARAAITVTMNTLQVTPV